MNEPFCFNCRFFVSEGKCHNDLTEDQWDECLEGKCHAGLPVLGQMLKDRHGDSFRDFGEWPKVMASDWCGKHIPCGITLPAQRVAPSSPTLAR